MRAKKSLPILACLCAIFLILGIAGKAFSENDDSTSTAASASVSANTAALEEKVFPKDKVVDVKITVDADDFLDMLDNAASEEIKTASVEYNGIKLDNVGFRTKGNLSLSSVVNSDSDRYSFKLSFDEYLTNQTLFGISKINLQNSYSDPTYMREFLTYELAEEMGLPTPKYSFVNVYVNGKLWGFYLAVEQIGDEYLERNFGNTTGSLYKAIMQGNGGDLMWQDDDYASYPGLVKKQGKSDDALIDMLDELNNGSDYASVLDVEEALKYIALNAVASNSDSYLGSNKQNYYLYENDGIFSVLPWDYNMAFGGLGKSSLLIDEPTQGALAERPLIAKLLAVDAYKKKYHEIITNAVNGYLSADKFKARVQEIAALISPYVKADPRPFSDYAAYESGITSLISFNDSTVENIKQQLSGEIASSGDGSGSGGGMGGGGMGGPGMNGPGGQGQNGQMQNGQGPNGQVQDGQVQDGQAQNGQGQNGQLQNGQGQDEQGQNVLGQNNDTQAGNAQDSTQSAIANAGNGQDATEQTGQVDLQSFPAASDSAQILTASATSSDAGIVLAADDTKQTVAQNGANANGGNANGGNANGGNANGGNADGGNANGGNANGGNANGGNANGGNADGGNANGGNANGGNANGGNANGGNANGGNANGGNANGGNANGGNANGGNANGGNANGANANGGNANGANANGGNANGGSANGGNANGGNFNGQNGPGGGFGGQGGGPGGMGGGFGGGGMGGPDGQGQNNVATAANTKEAISTLVSILLVGAACLFVANFRRKRL